VVGVLEVVDVVFGYVEEVFGLGGDLCVFVVQPYFV